MEPKEQDTLDSLLGDNQLYRTSTYDLLRKDGWVQIIVREGLHGPDKGKFLARLRIQSSSNKNFTGEGSSETQALKICLANIQHVQIHRHIPEQDDSDPDWSDI